MTSDFEKRDTLPLEEAAIRTAPDPRMIALVRLIARNAAENDYANALRVMSTGLGTRNHME